jgi:hypothetical protein
MVTALLAHILHKAIPQGPLHPVVATVSGPTFDPILTSNLRTLLVRTVLDLGVFAGNNRGTSKGFAMPIPENTPSLRSEQTRSASASLTASLVPSRGSISPHDTSEPISRTVSGDAPARLSGWSSGVPDSVKDGGGGSLPTPITSSEGHTRQSSLAFDKSLSWGDSVDDEPAHRKPATDKPKDTQAVASPKPSKPGDLPLYSFLFPLTLGPCSRVLRKMWQAPSRSTAKRQS